MGQLLCGLEPKSLGSFTIPGCQWFLLSFNSHAATLCQCVRRFGDLLLIYLAPGTCVVEPRLIY